MADFRIASLVPSATELLCALGLAPWLVARTGFCIHPAALLIDVPKVGGTKDVNLARLRALQPTHVLLNIDENLLATFEAIKAWPGVALIVTHPCGPRDVPALVGQCLDAFGHLPHVAQRATALLAELTAALARPVPPPRSVLYLIWRSPWMTVARDTFISRQLAEAGWLTLPALEGGERGAARYPQLAEDDPVWQSVDEVWLSSEPYRFAEQHLAEVQSLAPQARVRLVDGELCSWWGPRTAEGLAYLRELHPH
jgi:ABC-type Fe3+-hydroxamate transport system substrate-binding protein